MVAAVVEYRQEAESMLGSLTEVKILVPECYKIREYVICGVNAGADDHQPPEQFAGGGNGGHEVIHRAFSRF